MRLEFRVLWFDDQMEDMRAGIRAMKRELSKHGFQLVVDEERDASRLEELARQQELFHDYDLVVVDYNLGDGNPKGDEVARRIRNSFGFTDIIFYSGTPTDILREKVKEQAIDGVYCSERRELRVKLIEHVGFVVERLSRLEGMRGLAVVTAGRGDDHMREVVRLAHALMDEAGRDNLIAAIDKQVRGFSSSSSKRYEKVADLEDRLASRSVTSMVLARAASDAVQGIIEKHPDCAPELELLGRYVTEVIEPRNTLGHIVEVREENGWVIRSRNGVVMDRTTLSKFRTNLSNHLGNFVSLTNKLNTVGKEGGQDLADGLAE